MNARAVENPVVAIAHARRFENNEAFFQRHEPLVRRLADYGAKAIALNGAKDSIAESEFGIHYVFNHVSGELERRDTPLTVHSSLDLTGGIARYTPSVASLNPVGIREATLSKQRQYDILQPHLGEALPQTVTSGASKSEIMTALDSIDADKFVVKADTDNEKIHGVITGTKDMIIAQLDEYISGMNPEKDTVIVQEYMSEVEGAFASGIDYFDETEKQIAADRESAYREMRVHTIDGKPILVTGSTMYVAESKSVRDKWIHLNQDTIPSYVTNLAADASQIIQETTRSTDSYLAVDLTPDGRRIVEINGKNIGTMRQERDRPGSAYAASVTTDALASKLTSMAHINRGAS